MNYFAYGSNIDINRIISRGINPISVRLGILDNYKFIINKRSKVDPFIGYANIIPEDGSFVEGLIYEVSDDDILRLDKFEGYPNHYYRKVLSIGGEMVVVYIANVKYVSDIPLRTTKEYRDYILEGKQYFSDKYYNKLLDIIVI
jgi:gamma-glutamylcyclotransferase (GGCT)/AIG2-like uncharacterized protein YtfP